VAGAAGISAWGAQDVRSVSGRTVRRGLHPSGASTARDALPRRHARLASTADAVFDTRKNIRLAPREGPDPRRGARRTPPRPLERKSILPRVAPERDRDPSRWSSVVQSASRPRLRARRGWDADSSSTFRVSRRGLTRLPTRVGPSFPAPSSARA